MKYRDKTGGPCPPDDATMVGRARPAGPSASMQDVIKRQLDRKQTPKIVEGKTAMLG